VRIDGESSELSVSGQKPPVSVLQVSKLLFVGCIKTLSPFDPIIAFAGGSSLVVEYVQVKLVETVMVGRVTRGKCFHMPWI
jgi:hypothetical protein